MNEPTVSVIVPTYGRPAFLQHALESVLLQTFPDWECLVVDDASGQIAQVPSDPRFRWIQRSSNGGPGAARNTGMEAARGKYIAFLDDDDLLTPVRLQAGLMASRDDTTAITLVQLAQFDEVSVQGSASHWAGAKSQERRYRTHFPSPGQVLIPRQRVQNFDESMRTAEDAEWWLRVVDTGPLRLSMILGYLVRRHPGVRPGIGRETTLDNRLRLYEKHETYLREHRRARSYAADRVASAAILLGRRRLSAIWASRSLLALPTPHAARVLRRAVVGVRPRDRNEGRVDSRFC